MSTLRNYYKNAYILYVTALSCILGGIGVFLGGIKGAY